MLVAIVVVSVGAVVLLGRESSDGTAADEIVHPEQWDPRVEELAEWVEHERGLRFEHPVDVEFLDEAAYIEAATAVEGTIDAEEEVEVAAAQEDFVALLRAVGLVAGEVDLGRAGESLAGDGTLAHYSTVDEVVRVKGTEITPAMETTVVHELTHALQDQHFDLERVADPDFDRPEQLRAMAEGDALRMEGIYIDEELSDRQQEAIKAEWEGDQADAEAAMADVPPTLMTLTVAPYRLGNGFLRYIEAAEGEHAIDEVLIEPPTEEELLDPRLWLDGTEQRQVELESPRGVEQLSEVEPFGPLTLYLMLASRGDPVRALATVDGWAGDSYVVYRDGETVCASIAVLGDSVESATAIEWSFQAWSAWSPEGTATISRSGDRVDLRACDPGPAGGGEAAMDLLDAIDGRVGLEGGMVDGGAMPEQAACASRRILDDFGLAFLTDEALTTDPGVGARVRAHMDACR